MLVLSRRTGQSIAINDNIRITVVRNNGAQVAIGIEAPSEHRIFRTELLERITEGGMDVNPVDPGVAAS